MERKNKNSNAQLKPKRLMKQSKMTRALMKANKMKMTLFLLWKGKMKTKRKMRTMMKRKLSHQKRQKPLK